MSPTHPHPFPPPWADAWGDDRYGLWAEWVVKDVRQRLRWIEPGQFLMGSPNDEKGRYDDEGPQHLVTLTQGFWLADTTCTQALWVAVMGSNPSYVQDDLQKPVEQVSWDDAQVFFKALQTQALLPAGNQATLPTEAQWEYACRAGRTTAFFFGETISAAQVNFDHDGRWIERQSSKQTTVPVKALPANAWGLYQMHGNVWEWCADAQRDYVDQPRTDPSGAMDAESDSRAVRGGSWFDLARDARSAQRFLGRRDVRGHFLGFRFALRSESQPEAAGPRPAGAPGR